MKHKLGRVCFLIVLQAVMLCSGCLRLAKIPGEDQRGVSAHAEVRADTILPQSPCSFHIYSAVINPFSWARSRGRSGQAAGPTLTRRGCFPMCLADDTWTRKCTF
jgi:hypothetical protein